ncbi:universal stress protein [Kitasatospora sp. NBC_00374]|uniref:universal stress protein n=1 Tax=Kitasatospora sp. NBC_00374 TaxID=2975964 RepID=UPI0030E11076
MNHAVVVGVDGSAQSAAAAACAAEEARRSGRVLRMVHVVEGEGGALAPAGQPEERLPEGVTGIRDRTAAVLPELETTCRRMTGRPAYVLAAAGEREGLLVLGSWGLGGVAGLLVGSVGLRTAAHARCPVVLVRDGADDAVSGRGEVVVGVRGERPCDAVLAFAFDQAARRGTVLRAVEARTSDSGPYVTRAPLDQQAIRARRAAWSAS